MNSFSHLFDAKHELLIQPFRRGIKLVRPDSIENNSRFKTLEQVLNLSANIYLINTNSVIEEINEQTIITAGFRSVKKAIGQTSLAAATQESAEFEFRHDRAVISSRQMIMKDELYIRQDGISWSSLAIKLPWYYDEQLIGVFGCTIVLDKPHATSLADILAQIAGIGILAPVSSTQPNSDVYLTKRQKQVLKLVGLGKTIREIALQLSLSPRTVEHHIEHIKDKLNASTKADLISLANIYDE